MQDAIICRNATKEDISFIYNALLHMADEEKIRERFHLNESELFDHLFGKNQLAEVIVAEINHILVGLVMFTETNRNFTLFKQPGMYVHDLYVLPAYREKRIATRLAKELKRLAQERSYGRIDWVVLNDNQLGRNFFGRLPDAIKLDYFQCMRINLS